MPKKIRILSLGAYKLDDDSVAVPLNFDGVPDPDTIVKLINETCPEGSEVTWGHFIATMIAIWKHNREVQ